MTMALTVDNLIEWINNFSQKVNEHKDYLSELDTPIGDGDHGNNMARGVNAVQESLTNKKPAELTDAFKQVAMALISKVGGASGPLYGTAFLEMAKKSKDTTDLGELFTAANEGVKKRGGAKVGDKTMVDVFEPLAEKLTQGLLEQSEIDEAVEGTKDLVAKKGRASYLGERSVGHLDPGAMSSGYLFSALIETEGIL
ncbi:dihydroxyacetone kinase [Ligilactobacillus pobuzihii E100301 = KCTC 13174]|uniref:phosphoenolpyruvate--glycerone phosphotransferase n=2 Tax=Ligilactobacillus pobuzihii TaxID=449659 RepID=A0A0R2LDU3_9LACO|nr:dihydroxyacetone kinase [Ligilactobacillus pobuzihii E100301 = KCTC 13174]KRN98086.1 dihydroxyacetone kinase [Ligilactobacillus pobuzihii]